jgi:hypothetical protein
MGQNFNRSEPSLKDIVRDQLRINLEVGRKLLATDRILESIDSKMNNFKVAVQNLLNFNKVLEMRIAQLAAALPHPNGGDFPGQPLVPIKENVKVVITRSGKTMVEPKAKSKKMSLTDPVEEEEKAEAVIPCFEIVGTKPPYVCPGCFIHTYSNNMINKFHVQ